MHYELSGYRCYLATTEREIKALKGLHVKRFETRRVLIFQLELKRSINSKVGLVVSGFFLFQSVATHVKLGYIFNGRSLSRFDTKSFGPF